MRYSVRTVSSLARPSLEISGGGQLLTEDKPSHEPTGIVDARRGRDERRAVQEHGNVDILETCIREPTLPPPERHREGRADKQRPEMSVIERSEPELSSRSDQPPTTNKRNHQVVSVEPPSKTRETRGHTK